MSILSAIAEGGQTWAHRMRMLRQVIKIAVLFAFLTGSAVFVLQMSKIDGLYYKSSWYYIKASTMDMSQKK